MCSVASLALAGALFANSPSSAQGNPDNETGPQYSTPAEKAQTQQLNQQNAGGAVAPADQAQYDQQQQQYQDQQAQYHAEHRTYERNIHRYDEARYYFTDYPHSFPYRYKELRSLTLVSNAHERLADLPIEGPDGRFVGRERSVDVGFDGETRRVEVALNRRVSVWVDVADLRYDPENRVLYTDLTRTDLWNMPGSPYNE
jgi:hypothetical protein